VTRRARRPPGRAFLLIIRGPLGSGKTTVSRAVARALRARVVSIDEILELYEWDGGSLRLFLRANRVAALRARRELARGVPVVVDGNFYWKRAIDDLLGRLPFPSRVFTLRVPLRVCIARDRARALSYGKEATRLVFAKVNRFEYGIPVDGTRPLAEIVRRIRVASPPREPTASAHSTGNSPRRPTVGGPGLSSTARSSGRGRAG
jgi:hypothetical protein